MKKQQQQQQQLPYKIGFKTIWSIKGVYRLKIRATKEIYYVFFKIFTEEKTNTNTKD